MSKKDSLSRKIFYVCNIVFMLCLVVVTLFPYLHVLAKAFNDGRDSAMGGITLWPRVFTLENFKVVLTSDGFGRAFVLSVARVALSAVLNLMVQFMAAYVLMNKNFHGHKFFVYMFMIPMYFGGGIIPQYILYSNMGLLNNFLVYIIPGCFSMYNTIIIRSYLESLPFSLAEAAKIDGANDIRIAYQVILPLAKPVMATVGLWTMVGAWNDWTTTLYFVTKKDLFTMQYVLMRLLKENQAIQSMITQAALNGEVLDIKMNVTSEAIQSAQLIVTTIPIVIVYPFLQKYFIQGMTLGAVKN